MFDFFTCNPQYYMVMDSIFKHVCYFFVQNDKNKQKLKLESPELIFF